ncbi:hypothetical protein AAVH_07299 [Aphelenchoides avenae]|nr:hypothetical protein AAVH_07299 [Aphelenchus avenae]
MMLMIKAYRESVEETHIIVANEESADADDKDEVTPISKISKTKSKEYDSEPQAVADITEHEDLDREYDATFPKRVSCFDHCLELVLKNA